MIKMSVFSNSASYRKNKYHILLKTTFSERNQYTHYIAMCGYRVFQDRDGYKYFQEYDQSEIDPDYLCTNCVNISSFKSKVQVTS